MSKSKKPAPARKTPALLPLSSPPPEAFPPQYDRLLHALHTAVTQADQTPPVPEVAGRLQEGGDLQTRSDLNRRMLAATWHAAAAAKPLRDRIFLLSPLNADRLRAASPDQAFLVAELENLSGMARPPLYDSEPLDICLAVLGRLPEEDPPDWKDWFGRPARNRFNVPKRLRPPQHTPALLEAQLQRLLAAPARTAMPGWTDLARSLIARPWQPNAWHEPVGSNETRPGRLPLSSVIILGVTLRRAAAVVGCPPETYGFLARQPLDSIADELEAAGLPLDRDCGRISAMTPPELKAKLAQLQGKEQLTTLGSQDLWSCAADRQIYELLRQDPNLIALSTSGRPDRSKADPEDPRLDEISSAELMLLDETAPSNPQCHLLVSPEARKLPWAAFARAAATTPAALAAYLDSEADHW